MKFHAGDIVNFEGATHEIVRVTEDAIFLDSPDGTRKLPVLAAHQMDLITSAVNNMGLYVHGTIFSWQEKVHKNAVDKGFYEGVPEARDPMWLANRLCLIHSELSEALECVRDGDPDYYEGEKGKPEGLAIELADVAIRLFDLCESVNINLSNAIAIKHEYNKTRPRKHGGKKL